MAHTGSPLKKKISESERFMVYFNESKTFCKKDLRKMQSHQEKRQSDGYLREP
jgi:hypothetical protein